MPRLIRLALVSALLAACVPAAMIGWGWLTYKRLERSIIEKMDRYYLDISTPGREEYLLESDEVFEVPYMASRLSVEAVPTRIYDINERLIGEFSSEKGSYVRDPDELPAYLKKALVATEDGKFYEHHGVNYKSIARAMLVNLRSLGKKQGGSTLTQQLAKLMFTTRKKTFGRKIFEIMCAKKLESKFTKDQILLMYFNLVYFGHGCYGIESAAQYYFGKPARELELPEASMLAGIIANPTNYSPYDNPTLSQARHRTVLARMAKLGFIAPASVERYWSDFWSAQDRRLRTPETSFWKMKVNEAPYVVELVRRRLEKDFSKERILRGGMRVHTTIDLDCQKAAQEALQAGLAAENRRSSAPVEGALAALRPSDGAILAVVGGRGFNFSNQLNRAMDIARPMGSSVKPFIWAAAFESGKWKPEDKMIDEPLHFNVQGQKKWSPRNYGNKYFGEVTLREALERSLNSVAIKLLKELTLGEVIRMLSGATGLPTDRFPRDLSLALGTADVSPLQLAAAYAAFARDGAPIAPYYLKFIDDRNEKVVLEPPPREPPIQQIANIQTCRTILDVMSGVFRPNGTAHAAALRAGFEIPAAGKTGTTNESRDAWFTGLTPDVAASVWIGHDDMRRPLERGKTGGNIAAPIWMNFMKAVYKNRPTREFEKPEAVETGP